MPIIKWSEELSVGIDSIDDQHKVLISLINSLNKALAEGEANMMVGVIIKKLEEYTRFHFSYEEELFEEHKYKGKIEHIKQHEALIGQIAGLKERFESDVTGATGIEIMQFLKQWLTLHIMKSDKAYSKYLIAKNVK